MSARLERGARAPLEVARQELEQDADVAAPEDRERALDRVAAASAAGQFERLGHGATVRRLDRLVKMVYYSRPHRRPRPENHPHALRSHPGAAAAPGNRARIRRGRMSRAAAARDLRRGRGPRSGALEGPRRDGCRGAHGSRVARRRRSRAARACARDGGARCRCSAGPELRSCARCLAIQLAGSDAQRNRWLPDLASGERIATIAFAERADVWDPESWSLAGDPQVSRSPQGREAAAQRGEAERSASPRETEASEDLRW